MDEVSPFEPTVVGAVSRNWRLVLAVVVAVVIPAGIFAVSRPAAYTAVATLTVSDPRGPGVLGAEAPVSSDRYVSGQLEIFRSATLGDHAALRGAAQVPPLKEPPSWFLAHTRVSATATDNNLVSVAFSAPSSVEAMAGVRSVVSAYGDVVRASVVREANAIGAQLDSSIASLNARLQSLRASTNDPTTAGLIQQLSAARGTIAARRDQVAAEAALPGNGVLQALLPDTSSTAGKMAVLRTMVLALVLGLFLGIGLAYARSYRKRVFVHPRDPELVLGAPLLADVSSLRTAELLGLAPKGDAPRVEARARDMFGIAASLIVDQFEGGEGGVSLAVVSTNNGANCTAVAWRCAFAFASQGLRVVLIDINGYRPPSGAWMSRVAEQLFWGERADGRIALSDPRPALTSGQLLAGEQSAPSAFARPQQTLYFCGAPPPVRSEKALRALFGDLEHNFDIVLFNAPSFLPSANSAYLTSAAGGALVVVPDGGSVTDHEEFTRRLGLTGATTIGYVYCSAETHIPRPPRERPPESSALPSASDSARAS